ncbi:MAG: hypothetical protein HYY85_15570, partial [Deltaproteobacteria bacterium]|nr:hypothetical protein [Deltaproteobacteria bacterium]
MQSLARGQWHSAQYGIVQPLLALPLYTLGHLASALQGVPPAGVRGPAEPTAQLFTTLLMPVLVAGVNALFCGLALRLGYPPGVAAFGALALGLSTILWPYAKTSFTEPLNAGLLLLALAFLTAAGQSGRRCALVWAGCSLAVGGLNSLPVLLVGAPTFGLGLLVDAREELRERHWVPLVRRLCALGLPMLAGAGVWLLLNYLRRGHPLATGYEGDFGFPTLVYDGSGGFSTPLLIGVYSLLFSAGKSLFLYSPLLALTVWWLPAFWRRHRTVGVTAALVSVGVLLFYARWHSWHGDIAWGPRYLVPTVPLLILPILEIGRTMATGRRPMRWTAGGLLALGVIVQLLAVSVDYGHYFARVVDTRDYHNEYLIEYLPHFNPIWGQVEVIRSRAAPFDLRWASQPGWPVAAVLVLAALSTTHLLASALAGQVIPGTEVARRAGRLLRA